VIIEVRAIGCNFPDILIVQGKYQHRPEFPFSPGCEVAGIVCGVGSGVTQVGLGERVFATMAWGGYAEVVAVDQRHVYALPDFMTFEEGAVFALHTRRPGAASSTARRSGGARRSWYTPRRVERARRDPARPRAGRPDHRHRGIVGKARGRARQRGRRLHRLPERGVGGAVRPRDARGGADVVFDPVGGDVFDGSTSCIAFEGRLW
jgi:NADPH2:quinone reductase